MSVLCRLFLILGSYYLVSSVVAATPKKIPIGAIFEETSLLAQTAFRVAVKRYNELPEPKKTFKLDIDKRISTGPVGNCFSLSTAICQQMSRGIFALFGVTNVSTLSTIESYSKTFHMPFITPGSTKRSTGPNFQIRMRPSYTRAMIEVIKHYKWKKVHYIYDSDEGLSRLQKLYDHFNDEETQLEIDVRRLKDVHNSYGVLRQLDNRFPNKDKYIVLDLSSDDAQKSIFRQIQNVGMNRASYHYLLGGLAMTELDLEDFRHGGVNITGFRLVNPDSYPVTMFQRMWNTLDSTYYPGAGPDSKPITYEVALLDDAVSAFVNAINFKLKKDPDVFKLTFRRGEVYNNNTKGVQCNTDPAIPWRHGNGLYDALTEVKFEGLTGHVAFNRHGYRKDYTLDVMEVSLEKGPIKVGQYKDKIGLDMIPQEPPIRNVTSPSKNRTRVVTTILSAPYLMLRKENDNGKPFLGNLRFEGYCADLAEKVAQIVEFDYILVPVADGIYGAKQTNGTWNGMVGELTRQVADLAIAPLTISSQRERVIDFSKPFMSLGISIMIKKPEKQKPGVFSFMDPLSYEIWMCIIFAYIGVSAVLFLVSRFSPYEWHIEDAVNGPQVTNDFTMLNSLWFSLGAFMQQGCDISPRSMSGRIVGSVWWFFTLIIISSYTANLAAFLTVERMLTPIESADDLAKQTEISYGTLDGGSTKEFFKSSKIAVYERMWSYMKSAKPSVSEPTTDAGVERVRNSKGKYAFLLESTMNEYYNQKKPCNTMKVGGNLDSKGYGIATPLGSELREKLSLAVLQLREKGELQKMKKKWWYDKGECGAVESKDSSQSALTLSNVAGIFYILIGGLGLSMITSLLEFLYKSRMEARRRKTTFGDAMRSKARLSIRGSSDTGNGGVGSPLHKPSLTMNTYSYTAPSQIISLDGYADGNTHTQV